MSRDQSAVSYWNALHSRYDRESIQYDLWLQQFEPVIQQCRTPIIDLGCGSGNDTKYLIERGKRVIACDYSHQAVEQIRRNFPEVEQAMCFDMTGGLPFDDQFTDLIIADLSLHYFTENTTKFVLREIRRVLTPKGVLLLRVNALNDIHYGAGCGAEIEPHYYLTPDGRRKRFFDSDDIRRIFDEWNFLHLSQDQITRYGPPKELWTAMCRAK